MTFQELKQDRRFKKLLILLPGIQSSEHRINARAYGMAYSDRWYCGIRDKSLDKGYRPYSEFNWNAFAIALIKYGGGR